MGGGGTLEAASAHSAELKAAVPLAPWDTTLLGLSWLKVHLEGDPRFAKFIGAHAGLSQFSPRAVNARFAGHAKLPPR
jgi:hypothetical protein